MKRICLCDWDGTLRPGFILEDWLGHLSLEKTVGSEFAIECRQKIAEYQKGVLPYEKLVIEAGNIYASALNGIDEHKVKLCAERFVLKDRSNLFAFTEPLLAFLRRNKIETIVVSGGPVEVLKAYGRILPISRIYALRLRISKSRHYTADVLENHGVLMEKERIARSFTSKCNDVFLALGNAPTDQPLFAFAKHALLLQTEDTPHAVCGTTQIKPESLLKHVMALLGQKGESDDFTV